MAETLESLVRNVGEATVAFAEKLAVGVGEKVELMLEVGHGGSGVCTGEVER